MTFAQGTRFDLRPSATLTGLFVGVTALATLAPWFTALPWWLRCGLSAGVAAYGLMRLARFRQPPFRSIGWTWDDIWTVTDCHGLTHVAELAGFRTVRRSVFLRLRWRRGAGFVALLPDNADPDALRLLRARLGHGG